MAVAVKNTPEVESSSLFERMAYASLAGAALVLIILGLVFYLIPFVWQTVLGLEGNAAWIIRVLFQMAALVGLIVLGVFLLGPKPVPGIRAGIFVALFGFLLVLLLTRWASVWIEHWSFDSDLFSPSVGAIITAIIGVGLLFAGVRLFTRPGTERFLVQLEEQGWFSAKPYKALQGLRVRRGTIFGILLLIGSGIWTLLSHNTLRKGPADWQLNIPFTGRVIVDNPGDAREELGKRFADKDLTPSIVSNPAGYLRDPSAFVKVKKINDARDLQEGQVVPRPLFDKTVQSLTANGKNPPDGETANLLVVDRQTLKEVNLSIDPATHVKIIERGAADFRTNQVVETSEYNRVVRELKASGEVEPQKDVPQPATGQLSYRGLMLLPSVQFSVPLLMLALGLWLAWRIASVPAFADFLIATEAEMNKVSWTTQRRLVQDTIVVLVTVVLMAFYLFSMDVVWKSVLSWPPIGVLKFSSEDQKEATQPPEDRDW